MPSKKKTVNPAETAVETSYVAVRDVRWKTKRGSGEVKAGSDVPEYVIKEVPWFLTMGDVKVK